MINDPQVKLEMFWYDSRSECLPGDSEEIKNAKWHFQRWQIQIKHLTHENLENLVEQLNSKIWEYLDKELIFYSES